MLATIWVTTACNLQCKYCYEGNEKSNKSMNIKTADKSIEYILKHFKEIDDDKLVINFHGGEPLLQFDLMKYIIEKFKEKFYYSDKKLMFGVTTNGILLSEEIAEYLCDNLDYSLSVSVDGTKAIHDANRILNNGEGSYDLTIDKSISLLRKRDDIRARMTFTSTTVHRLYDSIKHLVDIGFNLIVPVADYFDPNWDKYHMDILHREMEKVYEMYKIEKKKNSKLDISLVDGEIFKKGICTGGLTSVHIDPEGDLYPCSYVVENKEFRVGNIYTGIDKIRLKEIHDISNIENKACNGCSYYNCCYATRCKLINKMLTGDFNIPSPVMCAVENVTYRFSKHIV